MRLPLDLGALKMNLLSRPSVITSTDIHSAKAISDSDYSLSSWDPDDLSLPTAGSESYDGIGQSLSVAGNRAEDELNESDLLAQEEAAKQQKADAHQDRINAEIEEKVKEAYETGYEEGRLEGEIAEGIRLRSAIAACDLALKNISDNESQWQSSARPNIAALATAIARQIIGRELQTDADAIADLVRRALAEYPIDQPIRVRISPHDLSLISAVDKEYGIPPKIAPNRVVRWLADPLIAPGGCLMEGRDQIVDGRVDTALERVYRRLSLTHV